MYSLKHMTNHNMSYGGKRCEEETNRIVAGINPFDGKYCGLR